MAGVGVQVGAEGVLGALREVVIALNELLQLGLYVQDLVCREVVLDDRDTGLFEVAEETDFTRLFVGGCLSVSFPFPGGQR